MAVDDVGRPALFFHRLDDAAVEEHDAVVVVFAEFAVIIVRCVFLLREEVVIVDKVDLHSGFLDGSHPNDEGVVGLVDDEVHARQPDHFMKLVATFVNVAIARHEDPDFLSFFLSGLGQVPPYQTLRSLRQVGSDFLMYKKYPMLVRH